MRSIAGISGGRTSGMMAYLVPSDAVLSFQNTGDEADGTYDFIERIEQDIGRPIVRLEFRAPARGEPPVKATFEVVDHRSLSRKQEPFRDLLECIRTFRLKHNRENPEPGCTCRSCKKGGAEPVAPWARSRICTAYLKIRTQRKYCASLGWGSMPREYTEFVGLRADEPDRVARMRGRNDKLDTDEQAPLAERGIVESDVLRFWSAKLFDLAVPSHLGNCKTCFLKDEADIASAMMDPQTDPEWPISVERDYAPMRRGRPSFAQVYAEAPARLAIREALAKGEAFAVDLPPRRVHLIVKQELAARSKFSCECDAAKDEDFDLDRQLDLPEAA